MRSPGVLLHAASSGPGAGAPIATMAGGFSCLTAPTDGVAPTRIAAMPTLHVQAGYRRNNSNGLRFHMVSMNTDSKKPKALSSPFTAKQAQDAQRAWALFAEKPIEIKSSTKMPLILIPPGSFLMGSGPNAVGPQDDEAPAQVTLTKPYYIGKFEVTQGDFETVMGKNHSDFSRLPIENVQRLPIECVSWHDAVAFCKELTKRDHRAGVIPRDWEYALPTEAQWEYACRAGTTTETYFGNALSSKDANFDGSDPLNGAAKGPYLERPQIVGSYSANAFGLYDMHGNVREWCSDVYARTLPGGVDPVVLDNDEGTDCEYVMKGGDWFLGGRQCRAAFRFSYPPERLGWTIGFRVVLQPKATR